MDSTRMDISVNPGVDNGMRLTHTEIRVNTGGPNDTVAEVLRGKPGLMERLGLAKLFKRGNRPRKNSGNFVRKGLPSVLIPYVGIWIAPPESSLPSKLFFYLSRMLIMVGSGLLHFLLIKASLFSSGTEGFHHFIVMGAVGVSLLLTLLAFLLRGSAPLLFCIPCLFFIGLVTAHPFLAPTVDTGFFSILGHPPATYLNGLWAAFLLLQIVLLIFVFPVTIFLRIPLILLCLYSLSGFVANMVANRPLEGAWFGSLVFQQLPLIFAQPTFVAIHLVLPLLFLFSLGVLFIKGRALRRSRTTAWVSFELLWLPMMMVLGFTLLLEHRIPNAMALVFSKPLGIGLAEVDNGGRMIRLKTKLYDKEKDNDVITRYRFQIRPEEETGKLKPESQPGESKPEGEAKASSDKARFRVFVSDPSGFPVFYLAKEDLELLIDDETVTSWDFRSVASMDTKGFAPPAPEGDAPGYLLSVRLPPPTPRFKIVSPEAGKPHEGVREVRVKLEKTESAAPAITSLELFIDGVSAGKSVELSGEEVRIPASLTMAGNHEITVEATAADGRAYRKSVEVEVVAAPLAFKLAAPMDGDTALDFLPVAPIFTGLDGEEATLMRYLIDEQEVLSLSSPPYWQALDIRTLADGLHSLEVSATLDTGEVMTARVGFTKSAGGPSIEITKPALGSYVGTDVTVEVVNRGLSPLSEVRLIHAEKELQVWRELPPNSPVSYVWNTREVNEGSPIVQVKAIGGAIGGDQKQASDWVILSTGEGTLRVLPPAETEGLKQDKTVFVLDASISQADGWNGKTRWEWTKSLFENPAFASYFTGSQVGVVAYGSGHPATAKKCDDAAIVVKMAPFKGGKSALDKINPSGVSALYSGMEKGLELKPARMIILADSADSCLAKIPPTLDKNLKKAGVIVDILSLGDVSKEDKPVLEKLAAETGGSFQILSEGSEIAEKIQSLFTMRLKISKGEEVLFEGAVDGKKISLKPGTYLLEVLGGQKLSEEVTVQQGKMVTYTIEAEGGKAVLKPQ